MESNPRVDPTAQLPYLSAEIPPTGGSLRATADDFVVDEVPAYATQFPLWKRLYAQTKDLMQDLP